MQVSVDGFIEGPNKEADWMMVDDEEEWREINEMLNSVDALILGGGMYPGYEQYWLALLTNPAEGTTNQSAYAQRAFFSRCSKLISHSLAPRLQYQIFLSRIRSCQR